MLEHERDNMLETSKITEYEQNNFQWHIETEA